MASWITAQLKAAEGLLEAVDKTVSRTVGTLGLAEGESEQLTPEYGTSRSSANVFQAPSGVGTYQHPYPSVSIGSQAHPSLIPNLPSASHIGHSAAGAPWETRATGSSFVGASPSSGRALTPAGEAAVSKATAGFTIKSDAPIPFGGLPDATAPKLATNPPEESMAGLSKSGKQSQLSFGGSDAALPASKQATLPPSTVSGTGMSVATVPHGRWSSIETSATTLGTGSLKAAGSTSPGGMGPGAEVLSLPLSTGAGTAAGAAGLAAPSGPVTPGSTDSLRTETAVIADVVAVSSREEETAAAPKDLPPGGSHSLGAATGDAASSSPPSMARPTHAGNHASPWALSSAGQASVTAEHTKALSSPAPQAPAGVHYAGHVTFAQQQQQYHHAQQQLGTSGGGVAYNPAPTPVAALASATTTAASTLASATTSAVSHSLSFFNLVLDDPDTSSDGAGAASASTSGVGAAQQVQSLSRTCDQLRKRLEASRTENEQLEDMLARAEVRAQQEAALVSALREELAGLLQARATAESSLTAQLAVARSSLAEVSDKYEASQRTVLLLEGQVAALEESRRRLLDQQNDREGGMIEALRAELVAAEARLVADAKAHQASRAAAAAREMDLEQQISGSTAALADLTRSLEEANRKCRALEEEVVAAARGRNELSAQVAALQRQLEDAGIESVQTGVDFPGSEGRGAPGRGCAAAAVAAAAAELEVLRSELLQHRRAAQMARQAAEASQAQAETLTQELEALRQSAEQRKDTAQLEAQLREVSDMLYLKQTQMERLAADKAAQQLKTERELDSVRQELAKLARQAIQQGGIGRGGGDGVSSGSGGTPHDVIPMESLGEPYQRLVRHNRVGRAVKAAANFLDSTASTTSFVLRQYPLARPAVFMYALLIHLYVYLLIARMQRMATHFEAVTVAPTVA